MRTTVERAGLADIPVLVELMKEFHAESAYALDLEWAAESFTHLLRDETRGGAWLAHRGDDCAGYVVLALRHSMEWGGLAGIIDDLFVRPRFRRQRVGSTLLSALFETCRALHVAAVHVEVGATNAAAMAMYRAFGLRAQAPERRTLAVELDAEGSGSSLGRGDS